MRQHKYPRAVLLHSPALNQHSATKQLTRSFHHEFRKKSWQYVPSSEGLRTQGSPAPAAWSWAIARPLSSLRMPGTQFCSLGLPSLQGHCHCQADPQNYLTTRPAAAAASAGHRSRCSPTRAGADQAAQSDRALCLHNG